jgi:hypothetical protein
LNISSSDPRLIWGIWVLSALVAVLTVFVVLGMDRRVSTSESIVAVDDHDVNLDRQVAARVDSAVIYTEDMELLGITDPSVLQEWVNDQLLADMAVQQGMENPRKSRLLQERVRQIYLRDLLLEDVYSGIPFPDSSQVFAFMLADSPAYMIERHYFQILLADGNMADSIYQRLGWGESFQLTAERLSIGQKAGLGGDLGFLTAGELMAFGIPREKAMIDGLGEPVQTAYGWHILMVTEDRALEDTSRVLHALADDIHRQRMAAARDSVLRIAAEDRDIYIYLYTGQDSAWADGTEGSDIQ